MLLIYSNTLHDLSSLFFSTQACLILITTPHRHIFSSQCPPFHNQRFQHPNIPTTSYHPLPSLFSSSFLRINFLYNHNYSVFFLPFLTCFIREVNNVSSALRAEFARGDGRIKRKEDDRRRNIQPSDTLFVVNFHEDTTKREDLKMLFEPYGELRRIDMKRNYAFVQFGSVEEAARAKDVTNGGQLEGAVLTVEFVARQRSYDDRRNGGGGGSDGGRYRRDDRGGGGRDRGDDRRGGGSGRYDRGPPPDRYDRDDGGRDRYDDRRGGRGGDSDYRRDRSPDYRGNGGHRGGDRGRSPVGGPGYGRRSRSRSRSPPRYRNDRGGGYDRDRGGSRHDDRDRYDDYSNGGGGSSNNRRDNYEYASGRETGGGRSPELYRGGRDNRGYRD
jgi:splicing factor, arginine/serine-rich 4/5/6